MTTALALGFGLDAVPPSMGLPTSHAYRGPRLFLPMAPVGVTDGRVPVVGMWIKETNDDVFAQRLAESGAAWARTFITWAEVEPVRTDPPTYDWTATDRAIRVLRQRNIEPLIGIADAPP
ncbi:MAG: hypothetical protein NZ518_11765, partial [Dehalococcoidia bacterium]|nr:hypothetical protein [Dehalococcoidia bacterium]